MRVTVSKPGETTRTLELSEQDRREFVLAGWSVQDAPADQDHDLTSVVRAALQAEAETRSDVIAAATLCRVQYSRYHGIGTRRTNSIATQYKRAAAALDQVLYLLDNLQEG